MPVPEMQSDDHLILIVDDDNDAAGHLKELLEFMDAPLVEIATVGSWRSQLGERRLSAIFLGAGLDEAASAKLIGEIGHVDPNIYIVIVDAKQDTA